MDLLRALQHTNHLTILMVTHEGQLAGLADRCVHMEQLSRISG